MKKVKKKLDLKPILRPFLVLSLIILPPTIGISTTNNKLKKYEEENINFNYDTVNYNLDYYGGDIRYVDFEKNNFLFRNTNLYQHFSPEYEGPIKVGVDKKDFQYDYLKQIDMAFDYLNNLFEVINPNIKFEVVDISEPNCSIRINGIHDEYNPKTGATVEPISHDINKSRIIAADIKINLEAKISNTYKRYVVLHEMMHVLTGSHDVNERESQTFSTYNYGDVGYMVSQIDKQKTEIKNSFISYTPLDVSTLIALYGDSSVKENRIKYLELLEKTLEDNTRIFTDLQPYYLKGFDLPNENEYNIYGSNEDEYSLN